MSDIFVSYASQDRLRVKPIVQALEARGWSVWWDKSIQPGEIWDEVIGTEMNMARCVVVFWSQYSIESSWVRSEAYEAKQKKVLVPALLDNVHIPIGFAVIQAANLVNWTSDSAHSEFDKLTSAIASVLSRTPAPSHPDLPTVRNQADKILEKAVRIRTRRTVTILGGLPLALALIFIWYVAEVHPLARSAEGIGLKHIEKGKYSTGENDRLGNGIRTARSIKILMPNASSFAQVFRTDLETFFSRPDTSMQVILATADSDFYREMMPMTFDKKWEEKDVASETNMGLMALSRKRLVEASKDENKIEFKYFDTQFRLPLIIIDDKDCYLTIRLPPNESGESPRLEFEGGYAESCTRHFNRLWQLSSPNATKANH